MKWFIIITFVAGVIICAACTTSISGNSSETNNGVIVVASRGGVEGSAPPYSSIYLIHEEFQPFEAITFDSMHTDSTGEFAFHAINGRYNLFFYGLNSLRSLVKITISDSAITNDTVKSMLQPPGSIQGYIPNSVRKKSAPYLYLEGTPFFTSVDSAGFFKLDSIPEGVYTLKQFAFSGITIEEPEKVDTLSFELTSKISVKSDSLLILRW